ncbi:MAG: 50S ribosomal protein L31 [Chloroflexi bacterium]|nr:50S ribosomal protein L31 [Chloroflexota bacterium]
MKPNIHPIYGEARVVCSCGNTWTAASTKREMHVEVCNVCHPFFTGQIRLVDTQGRVERLRKRYSAATTKK